jgi:hypothetical protein
MTSYLYKRNEDDQIFEDGSSIPWPYVNTGLYQRPPTGTPFTGSGECIGCPKIASNIEYSGFLQNFTGLISNEWRSVYPEIFTTGSGLWETKGAKININYSFTGETFGRLLVGYVILYPTGEAIESNYYINWYHPPLDTLKSGFENNLYRQFKEKVIYEPYEFFEEYYNSEPIIVFDSCAVRNITNRVTCFGPTPGRHFYRRSDDTSGVIYVKYFSSLKNEDLNPLINPIEYARADIKIAGFGYPEGLVGWNFLTI